MVHVLSVYTNLHGFACQQRRHLICGGHAERCPRVLNNSALSIVHGGRLRVVDCGRWRRWRRRSTAGWRTSTSSCRSAAVPSQVPPRARRHPAPRLSTGALRIPRSAASRTAAAWRGCAWPFASNPAVCGRRCAAAGPEVKRKQAAADRKAAQLQACACPASPPQLAHLGCHVLS